jgi:hypothetical protein
MQQRPRLRAALVGVTAAAVALGVAELVAVATGPRSAPLIAVGGVVVDGVPEPVKQLAIEAFGVHDKTALLVGTVLLLAVFAAVIGVLALRSRWFGVAGIAAFGLVGVVAAVTRPGAGPAAALPSVVGSAAAAGVLWLLMSRLPQAAGEPAERPTLDLPDPDRPRRRFLQMVGLAAGGAAVAGAGGRFLSTRRDVAAARGAVVLPAPASPAPAVPAAAELGVPGLAGYVTANRDFYRIDTALVVPRVDPRTWQLKIHGRVRTPLTIGFDELLRRPAVERYVTLACVSNEVGGELIGNARWLGVPVKQLLATGGTRCWRTA